MRNARRTLQSVALALTAGAFTSSMCVSQEADDTVHVTGPSSRNILRVGAFRADPQGDAHGRFNVDVDDFGSATGLRVSLERRVGRIAGLDFKYTGVRHNLRLHQGGERFTAKAAVRTFGMDVLFHPVRAGARVDYYAGFGLAYVNFGGSETQLSDIAAPLLRTGLDIKLGRGGRWGVNLDVQRLFTNVFDPTEQRNDYNAVHYGAAALLRF